MKISKKIIFGIGLVTIVIISLGIIGFSVVHIGWPQYENVRFGFRWYYPKGWLLEKEELGAIAHMPGSNVWCRAYGFPNVLLGSDGGYQTLDEFVEFLMSDENYKELETEKVELDSEEAVQIIWEYNGNIVWGVYNLNRGFGRGIQCSYPDKNAYNANASFQATMKRKFELTEAEEAIPKERKSSDITFLDTEYTEVTTIARDNWDENRLPDDFFKYEDMGYTCLPMPLTFDEESSTVTSVEWICEE